MLKRVISALVVAATAVWLLGAASAMAVPEGSPHDPAATDHAPSAQDGKETHGEGHGSAGVSPLERFQKDLPLWTAVVFLGLMAILSKYAWGPIAAGLAKRESKIHEDLASAERSNAEARRLLDEHQQKLAATGDEIRKLLEEARQQAERNGVEIVDKARKAADQERQRALAEIDQATQGALKELADRSASLAVDIAGKIVGSRLDRASHSRLIEQAMADFDKFQPGARKL